MDKYKIQHIHRRPRLAQLFHHCGAEFSLCANSQNQQCDELMKCVGNAFCSPHVEQFEKCSKLSKTGFENKFQKEECIRLTRQYHDCILNTLSLQMSDVPPIDMSFGFDEDE